MLLKVINFLLIYNNKIKFKVDDGNNDTITNNTESDNLNLDKNNLPNKQDNYYNDKNSPIVNTNCSNEFLYNLSSSPKSSKKFRNNKKININNNLNENNYHLLSTHKKLLNFSNINRNKESITKINQFLNKEDTIELNSNSELETNNSNLSDYQINSYKIMKEYNIKSKKYFATKETKKDKIYKLTSKDNKLFYTPLLNINSFNDISLKHIFILKLLQKSKIISKFENSFFFYCTFFDNEGTEIEVICSIYNKFNINNNSQNFSINKLYSLLNLNEVYEISKSKIRLKDTNNQKATYKVNSLRYEIILNENSNIIKLNKEEADYKIKFDISFSFTNLKEFEKYYEIDLNQENKNMFEAIKYLKSNEEKINLISKLCLPKKVDIILTCISNVEKKSISIGLDSYDILEFEALCYTNIKCKVSLWDKLNNINEEEKNSKFNFFLYDYIKLNKIILCKNLIFKVDNYKIYFQSYFSNTIIIPLDKLLNYLIPKHNEISILNYIQCINKIDSKMHNNICYNMEISNNNSNINSNSDNVPRSLLSIKNKFLLYNNDIDSNNSNDLFNYYNTNINTKLVNIQILNNLYPLNTDKSEYTVDERKKTYKLIGRISLIYNKDKIVIPGCVFCSKKLQEDNNVWNCFKCNKLIKEPNYYYFFNAKFSDYTGEYKIIVGNKIAQTLINLSPISYFKNYNENSLFYQNMFKSIYNTKIVILGTINIDSYNGVNNNKILVSNIMIPYEIVKQIKLNNEFDKNINLHDDFNTNLNTNFKADKNNNTLYNVYKHVNEFSYYKNYKLKSNNYIYVINDKRKVVMDEMFDFLYYFEK